MPGKLERPTMRVEGPDDLHSIVHLLIRHGIDYDHRADHPELPEFEEAGGIDELLASMPEAIMFAVNRAVGFVLDVDSPVSSRWETVSNKLRQVGLDPPEDPPRDGYIEVAQDYKATAGVWLMPDNEREGMLEDFLHDLIAQGDSLIKHAETATDDARRVDQRFIDNARPKAIMHTWLAWQSEPGRPYGIAMRARYFDHNAEVAQRFVDWFKRLYGIDTEAENQE